MKRIAPLVLILLALSASAFPQKSKDALYLKNGSQIFGKIEQREDNKAAIRISDGSLFVFDSSEVDHYIIEEKKTLQRKEKGLGVGAELGFLAGPQSSSYIAPFSFGVDFSYSFNRRLALEAGSGIEFIGNTYSPIFAGIRYCLSDRNTAPFLFGRAGYMVVLAENSNQIIYYPTWDRYYPPNYWYTDERDYRGGPTVTAGFGTIFFLGELETHLSFAYRHFRTKEIVTTSTSEKEAFLYYYDRLEIKFGFRF